MFIKCQFCGKNIVCKENLKILRYIIFSSSFCGGILGMYSLPLLRFGYNRIIINSIADKWQTSLGLISNKSLFIALKSLGNTNIGALLFGSIGTALPLLLLLTPYINFCDGNCLNHIYY